MKLLIQRVTRATLEVDGMVEGRIGQGLVLSLALRTGDNAAKAKKLAARVVKLLLWPDISEPEKLFNSTVVDNGFEILVMSQQSLLASLAQPSPSEQGLSVAEAKEVFEAFVEALKKEYQEEMIVGAPVGADMKVETVSDGPCIFELDTSIPVAQGGQPANKVPVVLAKENKGKGGAAPNALEKQTNGADEDDLDKKLAMLRDQVEGKAPEKKEDDQTARVRPDWQGRAAPNTPAGKGQWPGAAPWNRGAGFGYGGGFMAEYSQGWGGSKGYGRKGGKSWSQRSYGIASLDESARIHGARGAEFEKDQLSALPDHQMKVGAVKKELGADGEEPKRPASGPAGGALKRPKGMPTVAPMTPATVESTDAMEEL